MECCRLRVQDIDFEANQIIVRCGKGDKDRVTILPDFVKRELTRHLEQVWERHQQDLAEGAGLVELPDSFARKCPAAAREWKWQWVFPATRRYPMPRPTRNGVTTSMRRCSRRPCGRLFETRASQSTRAVIPFVTRLRRTFWKMASIRG